MLALDWIFGGVLLLSLLVGAWRGLVVEVLSLANWAVAFVVHNGLPLRSRCACLSTVRANWCAMLLLLRWCSSVPYLPGRC